jgi:TfoX/Sxy family transcriptional regulator of competence genes
MDISQIRYLEVLRDMASTNKYGSLGGAGVIILKTEVTEKEYQSSRNLWNAPPPLNDEERKALKAEKKAKRLAKKAKKAKKNKN